MSFDQVVVSVKHISKVYNIFDKPSHRFLKPILGRLRLLPFLPKSIRKKIDFKFHQYGREFFALHNISFDIKKGESFGIIGKNGAGKSTLLQIITGILNPTSGTTIVHGRVAALLELGAGFNPEFSGRENIFMNASILGFTEEQTKAKLEEIIDFSEIRAFIDQPVKTYSSGMFVRLAFSVQACLEPDILIVDEALSVGDMFFQQKCHARMEELEKKGTTLIFVSHDLGSIEKYCKRAMLLENGRIIKEGNVGDVVTHYYYSNRAKVNPIIEDTNLQSGIEVPEKDIDSIYADQSDNISGNIRWPLASELIEINKSMVNGDPHHAELVSFAIRNSDNLATHIFEMGEEIKVYYEFLLHKSSKSPVGDICITNNKSMAINDTVSVQTLKESPKQVLKGQRVRFCQTIKLDICPGEYGLAAGYGEIPYDVFKRIDVISQAELSTQMRGIVSYGGCVVIQVIAKKNGIEMPFYGIVGLETSHEVEVVG